MKGKTKRLPTLALLTAVAIAFSIEPAQAHAGLVAAVPAPGVGLPQAPGAAVLRFSEPLNIRLSRIEVVDRQGKAATVGPTSPVPGDPRAMQRKLGLLSPGQYTVKWVTVSTLDGHTLKGSYTFGIGTASPGNEQVQNSPVASEGWLGLIGRLAALVGLVLWAGSVALRRIAERAQVPVGRLLWLGRLGPLMSLIGTSFSVISSALVAQGGLGSVPGVLVSSPSGRWRAGLIGVSALGAIAGPRRRAVQIALVPLALISEAASGHAAASPVPVVATISFSIHLASVGVWVFAIAASALSSDRILKALASFTPYAVAAAAATALSGLGNAALQLSKPSDLWTTAYGKTLAGKTVVFLAMASLGLTHNLLRRRPRAQPATVQTPVRFEMLAALLALAFATALVGFPNPPREEEAAEALPRIDPVLSSLGSEPALSIARPSGPFIAGLTLIPPKPGTVDFRVQVLGVEAGDGLRNARVEGRSDGGSFAVSLNPCGALLGCFSGRGAVSVPGSWDVILTITSNRGQIELTEPLAIPATDGGAELRRAIDAMETLSRARMREELRGAEDSEPTISEYAFQAPNTFEIRIRDRHEIIVGETSYTEKPGGGWQKEERPGLDFTWPRNYYRDFWRSARGVMVLGTDEIDGVPSKIVSFVRPELPAWFQIWVGEADGLVRRQEMRAEGHIMDHSLRELNGQFEVEPPTLAQ